MRFIKTVFLESILAFDTKDSHNRQAITYCEITFIRGVPIFVVFVGRLIHEIKNPTNNESWEAV
jgi:hypothetical protein